ncbi:MAG: HEPN domain-containing protein [Planctomycetes bacterium]|nr:HEPN domain-containing protein [Planctomycetota bacterium]
MTANPRAGAFLEIAGEEIAAAKHLAGMLPRQAAYFAQQAVEKIARAILAKEGIPFGVSHNLGQMAACLPSGHLWRPRIAAFDRLSPAATSYRYPTPAGRLQPLPVRTTLDADIAAIEELLIDASRSIAPSE